MANSGNPEFWGPKREGNVEYPPTILVKTPEKLQIRTFESSWYTTLEENINSWLSMRPDIDIKDIKITCSTVENRPLYLAVIIYTVEG